MAPRVSAVPLRQLPYDLRSVPNQLRRKDLRRGAYSGPSSIEPSREARLMLLSDIPDSHHLYGISTFGGFVSEEVMITGRGVRTFTHML
jgi:hypothetical protein